MTRIPVMPDAAARAEEHAAVDAIARVLDAEHVARERIAQAEAEAVAREEAARAEARAIAERTERRLASVRAAFAARTARAVVPRGRGDGRLRRAAPADRRRRDARPRSGGGARRGTDGGREGPSGEPR